MDSRDVRFKNDDDVSRIIVDIAVFKNIAPLPLPFLYAKNKDLLLFSFQANLNVRTF